ncbi:hypothetical protein HKCCE3408_08425 [Rhodobacterales bacterium HKCCE3408]|nr:hypothetical protein [Rhodobacterales bacterium HKCCE3408]
MILPATYKPLAINLGIFFLPKIQQSRPLPRLNRQEIDAMSEAYQLELIRSYASAGLTAVVTINSGALIAGLSQARNIDFVPPAAIAAALLVWALGVTAGVASWGAAFRGVVANATADRATQMRWRNIAIRLFHISLSLFLFGFLVISVTALSLAS